MHPDSSIPTIRIDLALPPEERYNEVCDLFSPQMRALIPILDEILEFRFRPPWGPAKRVAHWLLRMVARRMHDSTETRELRGIARRAGVHMYFLVAFNVLLDCLMGCTSGAALVRREGEGGDRNGETEEDDLDCNRDAEFDSAGKKESRYFLRRRKGRSDEDEVCLNKNECHLMHFRTLDWGMDQLRDLLVVLEYVNSSSKTPDHVIARSITYAGFVGVLTAVRKDLSLSVNFRANHSCSTLKLRLHQLSVVLGLRPSTGSLLRSVVVPESLAPSQKTWKSRLPTPHRTGHRKPLLPELAENIASALYPPCYLTLCDPKAVCVIEKDLDTGVVTTSENWSCITNHDIATPSAGTTSKDTHLFLDSSWLEESTERRTAMQRRWEQNCKAKRAAAARGESGRRSGGDVGNVDLGISEEVLKQWVREYPVMNECTHFACIMDPKTGTVRWLERGLLEWDGVS